VVETSGDIGGDSTGALLELASAVDAIDDEDTIGAVGTAWEEAEVIACPTG
jgi:hypothetical protein